MSERERLLHEALRAQVVDSTGGYGRCVLCETLWPSTEGERHAAGCLADFTPPPSADAATVDALPDYVKIAEAIEYEASNVVPDKRCAPLYEGARILRALAAIDRAPQTERGEDDLVARLLAQADGLRLLLNKGMPQSSLEFNYAAAESLYNALRDAAAALKSPSTSAERTALINLLDWLCDPILEQSSYIESGNFYADRTQHISVAKRALRPTSGDEPQT